jgi:ribulose-5-phosphate 4-epimerase/fuculose-1-phosphate aldolase
MNRVVQMNTHSSIREHVSDAEWQTRVDLAACYRLVDHFGMSDMIYNHITAKVPDTEGHFLINAFGLTYDEITASNLYKIDLEGNVVLAPDTPYGVNKAGYAIHSAIHEARSDIKCVMHTHTRAGMAVSTMKEGILPLTQTSMRFYNSVGFHDYEVPTKDSSEKERIARDLGSHYAMIMRNHGLVACGRSIADAFNLMYWMEAACQVQVDVLASRSELTMPTHELATQLAHRYHPDGAMPFGKLEWTAMMRMMDRKDPSFRD